MKHLVSKLPLVAVLAFFVLNSSFNVAAESIRWKSHPNHPVRSLAFSPDGNTLAIGSSAASRVPEGLEEGILELHDLRSGKMLHRLWQSGRREFPGNGDTANHIESITFSPDGNLVIGGDRVGYVVWHTATGKQRWETHLGLSYTGAAFSPDGKLVVIPSNGISVEGRGTRVFESATGKETAFLELGTPGEIMSVDISPDGKILATTGSDSAVTVWNITQKQILYRKHHGGQMQAVKFSPDGSRLIAGASWAGVLLLHSVAEENGKTVIKELGNSEPSRSELRSAFFTADGKSLITRGWEGSVRIWDTQNWRFRMASQADAIALTKDGKKVAFVESSTPDRIEISETARFLSGLNP